MVTIKDAAAEFLANRRIAVTGVSRAAKGHGANVVYKRLRARGYDVYAVNPNADEVEGDPCYHDLHAVPGGVDAVVMATSPATVEATMQECVDLGIKYAWMHAPAFGPGSVSEKAAAFGREHGVLVIDGGCPLMFKPTADFAHKLMRTMSGKVPKQI